MKKASSNAKTYLKRLTKLQKNILTALESASTEVETVEAGGGGFTRWNLSRFGFGWAAVHCPVLVATQSKIVDVVRETTDHPIHPAYYTLCNGSVVSTTLT